MADKQISQLVAATTLNNEDLLVIQQGQVAKKLSGERLAMFVYSAAGSMIDEVNSAVEEAQAAVDELLEEKNAIAQTIADMAGLGTDTTLTTPGMAADSKAVGDRIANVEKDALAGLNQKTISDIAIASFDDGADDAPVKELIVNIEPVQDLHGQDAPYPAGGGKNKFSSDNGTYGLWISGSGAESSNPTCYVSDYFAVNPSENYSLSINNITTDFYSIIVVWYDNSGFVSRDIGYAGTVYPAVYTSPATSTRCRIGISLVGQTVSTQTIIDSFKIQFEAGSTATPWSPYSNICPITGRTGCEVNVDGANLWDDSITPETIQAYSTSGTSVTVTGRNLYLKSGTYTFSFTGTVPSASYVYGNVCNSDGSFVSTFRLTTPTPQICTITLGQGQFAKLFVASGVSTALTSGNIQLEVGSSATPYKPFNGITVSVDFPSEAGTVYGATLNLTTGKLIVDTAARQFDGSGDVYSFVSNGRVNIDFAGIDYKKGLDKDSGISNSYAGLMQTANNANFDSSAINYASCYNISSSANNFTVRIKDPRFVDLNTAQGILEEEPLVIIFNLNTPIVYNLTPIEVRTLLKINNIWANTGNINTIIYRTIPITEEVIREIMGDYEEIIAGVEYTGKATKNYYAGNLVIVNDILYKCLVNVASGETFTSGAGGNVSQTTIADELATLQALYDNLGNLALLSYTTA